MNRFQKLARKIIKISFNISISIIEFFSEMEPYKKKVAHLRKFEKGTLGKEIADCLDCHKLTLVPKYESQDLKHVLLNYDMTAEGEIRMQAFMIGNGNWALPTLAIFIFGAILLPSKWPVFMEDMRKGKKAISVKKWSIDEYADQQIDELRQRVFNKREEKSKIQKCQHTCEDSA